MPGGKVFLDTNVILYLHDRREAAKGKIAGEWLRHLTQFQLAQINLQVLNEAANAMLRGKWFESPTTVHLIINDLTIWGTSPVSWRQVERARELHESLSYSWWDCLLLAAAIELGCTRFLSEDLQDGQRIVAGDGRGLTIVDPFAHSPAEFLSS